MSETRRAQMEEVELVRDAFERKGMRPPRLRTLERALVVPEDRPEEECVANLPVPGSNLPVNPLLKLKIELYGGGAKKKSGGGKKKKKGGGKKKGKKKK